MRLSRRNLLSGSLAGLLPATVPAPSRGEDSWPHFETFLEAHALIGGIYFIEGRWIVAAWALEYSAGVLLGFGEIEPPEAAISSTVRYSLHPSEISDYSRRPRPWRPCRVTYRGVCSDVSLGPEGETEC